MTLSSNSLFQTMKAISNHESEAWFPNHENLHNSWYAHNHMRSMMFLFLPQATCTNKLTIDAGNEVDFDQVDGLTGQDLRFGVANDAKNGFAR
jgi:hypothetical protein